MAFLNYDAATWAWQTGTFGNERLAGFFAGDPAVDPPAGTDPIGAGSASLTATSDVVLLVQPGDAVDGLELFDGLGTAAGNGTGPLQLFYVLMGSTTLVPLNQVQSGTNTFDGSAYNAWVRYALPANVGRVVIKVPGRKALWPMKIRWTGTAGYVPATPVARVGRLDNKSAVNSYWYNIFDPSDVHGPPPAADLTQLRRYVGLRFYLPLQNLVDGQGLLRLYSALSGGAHYVELAQLLVQEGKFGVYSFMGNHPANIATWTYQGTDANGNPVTKVDGDLGSNAVWAKGADLYAPETYRRFGEAGWDFGAIFGSVTYPTSQLRQATTALTSYDPVPVVYSGLNLFGPDKITPQFGNELSKTWKNVTYPDGSTANAYLPPDAAAIAYAVWYDGYNNTMGPRVGICTADPAIKPTIGTLFTADAGYLHAFAEKLREIYGSNPDGSVKHFPLAADVHEYARDPATGAGLPFRQSPLPARFASLTRVLDLVSPASTLVLSEYGYARTNAAAGNVDSGAYVATGYSFLQPTTELVDPRIRRAAVTVDMAIELAELAVGQAYQYDDDHGFSTATRDLLWDQDMDTNGEPVQAWMNRLATVTTSYTRVSSTRAADGSLHAVYTKTSADELHIFKGGAGTLALPGGGTLTPYSLATGTSGPAQTLAAGGTYQRPASEVPTLAFLSAAATSTPTGGGGTATGGGATTTGGTPTPTPSPTPSPAPSPAPATAATIVVGSPAALPAGATITGGKLTVTGIDPTAYVVMLQAKSATGAFQAIGGTPDYPFQAPGGNAAPFTLTPTDSVAGILAGQQFTGTPQQWLTKMLVRYQAPQFSSFAVQGSGNQTVEVGTAYAAGFKSVTWATTNAANVTANSLSLADVTAGTTLASGKADTGSLSASTAAFTAIAGESRRYRLAGLNSQGGTFSADLTISGAYASYFGYSPAASLTGAQLVALGNAQLQGGRARTVGGVTATGGAYFYYVYEASAGDLGSIILDGAAPVLGAFQKLADVATTNAQGAAVTLCVYRSNAVNAFSNNSLAFS